MMPIKLSSKLVIELEFTIVMKLLKPIEVARPGPLDKVSG